VRSKHRYLSGDDRSFYVVVPYLGKFSRKYKTATFYKSTYYKSASLGRFSGQNESAAFYEGAGYKSASPSHSSRSE